MPPPGSGVKPTRLPAPAIGPDAYARWRATTLGRVTEALEQKRMLDLIGRVDGNRVLDLGCGDGSLTAILADRGAWIAGVDADKTMLDAAHARTVAASHRRPRFIQGRIERLPFSDATVDIAVVATALCFVPDRVAAVREAARVLRPGGRLVIGELARWNAWAARRRLEAWLGSPLWRSARFSTAADLSGLVEHAGLTVEAVRGSVYYPPIGAVARPLAILDEWLGAVTTVGAAFIALAARKPAVPNG